MEDWKVGALRKIVSLIEIRPISKKRVVGVLSWFLERMVGQMRTFSGKDQQTRLWGTDHGPRNPFLSPSREQGQQPKIPKT
mmetsp:Transcript_7696/g.17738  ORF Transcript_7696/g.17738 Transcript_7696/m.17738 type:complete len:81 (-) Transcript_7696:396-638(-)